MTKSRWTRCINFRAMENENTLKTFPLPWKSCLMFLLLKLKWDSHFMREFRISIKPLTFDLPHLGHRFQHGHCQWPSIDASHCSDTAVIRYNAGRYLLQIHHLQIRPWIFTLKKRRSCSKFLLKCPVWRSQNWLLWECEITTRLLPCRIVTMAQANGLWSETWFPALHDTPWNMEPTNHPFRKEHDLPDLYDYVPC